MITFQHENWQRKKNMVLALAWIAVMFDGGTWWVRRNAALHRALSGPGGGDLRREVCPSGDKC